ncbi:MAG: DUF3300 domain-containing protein [Phycisphaeraceae bacterium]|nr:DUF3300 domain-containing protein [Phycisphaeraceae bacterium]
MLTACVMIWSIGVSWCPPTAFAQQSTAQPPGTKTAIPATVKLSAGDLEELLSPIALYPDSLLANVLAASVYPDEVKQAADFVKGGGTTSQISSKPWEDPVKAIAAVPDAIKMMSEYLDWTTALGAAYINQSKDVMDAVQRLRARAKANGVLTTGEQQVVKTEGDTIIIQQADPEVVYVPSYNPGVVYVDDDDDEWAAAAIGFGTGIAVGAILSNMNCHWYGGCVGWGGGYHGDIDIDRNTNINIDNTRINNLKSGNRWQPNQDKLNPRNNAALSNYQGAGARGSAGGIPGRTAGARPIASRPAPRASATPATNRSRPGAPATRPAPQPRPAAQATPRPATPGRSPSATGRTPGAKPAIPPPRPAPRATSSGGGGSRSAYSGGGGSRSAYSGGGGSSSRATSRGGSSRGGGGRGGGGRGGGRR